MATHSFNPQPPQNVAVVLRIDSGSFDDGFPVTLQILEDGQIIQEDDRFLYIPSAPDIPQLYQEWKEISLQGSRQLQAVPVQVTNVSTKEEWERATERLAACCRNWFRDRAFGQLGDRIRANRKVSMDCSVPIIVRCRTGDEQQDNILRKLPWHLWNLFAELPNAEFSLFTGFREQTSPLTIPVRVLAIFGSSDGELQLENDIAALENLKQKNAQIVQKLEPSDEEMSHLLFDEAWDILFFAGHSFSDGESGRIQINRHMSLPLHALRQSLARAVANGLKLAIFNSCDGLGIADFLTELRVPAIVVMREPVPDRIACKFLLYFLKEFSQGTPLCLAVRRARDRLESIQSSFPAASWLPVVCLNPIQPELVWPPSTRQPRTSSVWRFRFLIGSVVLTGIVAIAISFLIGRCQIFSSICIGDRQVEKFISRGEKSVADSILYPSELYRSLKQQGIAAFAEGRYEDAVKIFDDLRDRARQNKNVPDRSQAALIALQDPEILIYRNNALVNHRHSQNPDIPIYTIAVAVPLNTDAGLHVILGVAQAQDVAIKQGIDLQVAIANDSNKPTQAQQIARKLANDPRILAVVGHYTSPNTCAALQIYSPNNLVVVAPTSTTVNLKSEPKCGGDSNNVFFRTVSTTRVEANTLVQYLVEDLGRKQPNIVVFYNKNELFSEDLFNQFQLVLKAFGGQVIAAFDLSDPNFNTRHLPSQVKKADALAVLPDGGTDNTKVIQRSIEIIKLNGREKPVLGANTLYLKEVIDAARETLIDNLFIAVDWHPKQCGAEAFSKQINEYWGGDLNRRTSQAYEAVQAILKAILSTNSQATRLDIQQRLSETGIRPDAAAVSATIEGLPISFDAKGDRREITTRAVVTVNNRLRFDLVKDVPCPNRLVTN